MFLWILYNDKEFTQRFGQIQRAVSECLEAIGYPQPFWEAEKVPSENLNTESQRWLRRYGVNDSSPVYGS